MTTKSPLENLFNNFFLLTAIKEQVSIVHRGGYSKLWPINYDHLSRGDNRRIGAFTDLEHEFVITLLSNVPCSRLLAVTVLLSAYFHLDTQQ